MSETKKFYRTVIQVEILSESPIPSGLSLSQIDEETASGSWVGQSHTVSSKEVSKKAMIRYLKALGSDPEFFGITE